MRERSRLSSTRLRITLGLATAGLIVLLGAFTGGPIAAGAHVALAATVSDSPGPVPNPSPGDTPSPLPSGATICETAGDPPPCVGDEPAQCPIDSPSPSPSDSPSPLPTATSGATTMAVRIALADPPAPCTIKVQQVVVVSELFKAPKAPKVGDTLDIQLDLTVPTKAKDAAQAAIDMVTKKGKTVLSVTMRAKVYMVDDLGALVVYTQVTGITVSAKGYSLGVGLADGSGAKLALPVVLP